MRVLILEYMRKYLLQCILYIETKEMENVIQNIFLLLVS